MHTHERQPSPGRVFRLRRRFRQVAGDALRIADVRSAFITTMLLLIACSGGAGSIEQPQPAAGGRSVAGNWVGSATLTSGIREGVFFKLQQSSRSVSGESCETETKDCNAITEGSFDDPTLVVKYTFQEDGATHTITVNTKLSSDGTKLSGTLASTKCACEGSLEASRR